MTASALPARPRARWILPDAPDPAVVRSLCDELLLPEPICRLLVARGHAPAEQAKRYLRPRLEQLLPPEQLLDLAFAHAGFDKAPLIVVRLNDLRGNRDRCRFRRGLRRAPCAEYKEGSEHRKQSAQ